jgi:hypothetical protein
MFLRLILLAILFFLTTKILGLFFKTNGSDVEVKGKAKSDPLDVPDNDIQDVDFKEYKE